MVMTTENTTGGMLNDTSPGIVGTSVKSYHILTIVIGILAVVLNGLLLIAMVRYRSTIFTSKGAYLIVNLTIADLLTGFNFCLWGLKKAFGLPQALNKALFTILWISIEASFLTILVMSLERYIAIVFPLKAQVWLSKSRTIKTCVAVWFIAALFGAGMALSPLIVKVFLTIAFEITLVVTMFFYYKIVIKLRQRRAVMTSMQSTGDRGYKLITVVVLLVVILIITVLLDMFVLQITYLRRVFRMANYDPKLKLFSYYYLPVQLMNFVLNPIVYALRLPKYRLVLLRTLRCS